MNHETNQPNPNNSANAITLMIIDESGSMSSSKLKSNWLKDWMKEDFTE
jgi:uncharacterized sporulation protein YeaH/YhbH (DUF444 family)